MSNIASSPEAFGLEVVADLDVAGVYEFDEVIVWRRKADGTLWGAHDSGCSCPIPFDDIGVDDLEPITDEASLRSLMNRLSEYRSCPVGDVLDFHAKVRRALSPVSDGENVEQQTPVPVVQEGGDA